MIAAERIEYLQSRIARFEDQHAYKELFTGLYRYLYTFAFSFVKSRQLSEEIVSDVFIKIWEKRKSLSAVDNLKVYLYVSTKNIALNYLDKQERNHCETIESLSMEPRSNYPDPEQLLITSDMMMLINGAILQLPPRCKLVFKLVKEDQLRYKEVAEILHISVKTVENQLAIALRKIGSAIQFDISRAISTSVAPTK